MQRSCIAYSIHNMKIDFSTFEWLHQLVIISFKKYGAIRKAALDNILHGYLKIELDLIDIGQLYNGSV